MRYYVARQSFRDDDCWIEAGKTFVADAADVYQRFPERFELDRISGAIARGGGTAALVDRPRHKPVSTTQAGDIETFGHQEQLHRCACNTVGRFTALASQR